MIQEEQIEQLMKEEISAHHIAGANVLVSVHGQTIFQESFGMADLEQKKPMQENTIFKMFSMSKLVTAAAAMLLFERGRIDLYDPVAKYLNGFQNQTVYDEQAGKEIPVKNPVLIRDLLNMTSGLSYPEMGSVPARMTTALFAEIVGEQQKGKLTGTVEFANRIGALPLNFEPGTRWMYGTGADVMGAVVETVSGMRFGEFLQKELFDPMEMNDTGFWIPEEKKGRFAKTYLYKPSKKKDGTGVLKPFAVNQLGMEGYDRAPEFESGGAGLVSTVEDYRRFGQMLLTGGITQQGQRILGKETVRFLRTNQLSKELIASMGWDSLRGYGYGNFNRILLDPAQAGTNAPAGEYGWDGWLGTYITLDPTNDFLFEYFIQLCDAGTTPVTRKLRAIAYGML
ncbi:MAG: beta-lactamase family protein [Butyrivibrio sp.]|nr:beta-lactamase family protein [Butyrivibrio sp.]